MAEEVLETEIEAPKKFMELDTPDIESQIHITMLSRVPHFKRQANSLTFEGVRRLLEKDLGLEAYALDVHKRFIKQCLLKCLEGREDDEIPKNSGEADENGASMQETEGSTEEHESKSIVKYHSAEEEENMDESPVLGLLEEQKTVKLETKEAEGNIDKGVPSETIIKKAIRKRASYIKANSEKVTMAGLRRLLEKDLDLEKFSLDPYKNLISQQLDEVLESSEVSKPAKNVKKVVQNKSDNKATKKVNCKEISDASDQESDEEEKHEHKVKPRNSSVLKGKMQKQLNSAGSKKRKVPPEETITSSNKRTKPAKSASEDNNDSANRGESEDDLSQPSPEKSAKKKEVSTPVYGKHVDQLKSVIKACGMSIPPSTYKKVKQAPENKQEAQLIKELEEILSREGLSSNPSEKEIKEVKRKKARANELEGIDLSNIVSSSRRRSTTSFAAPPKPKITVERNGDDAEESDDDDDEEEDEDEEEENSDDDGSQSEEVNEDEEDSD